MAFFAISYFFFANLINTTWSEPFIIFNFLSRKIYVKIFTILRI